MRRRALRFALPFTLLASCAASPRAADPPSSPPPAPIAASTPSGSTAAIVLGTGESSLEVRARDLREVPRSVHDGATIFADAAIDTDVWWVPLETGVEEWRVLKSPLAPTTIAEHLHGGAAISDVRVREGRIEAIDASGVSRISTAPLVAYDATGAALPLDASVVRVGEHDWDLEVSLTPWARATATYPIAIDPAWNFAFGFPIGRAEPCVAVVSDGRVLVVGGDDGKGHPGHYDDVWNPTTNTLVSGATGYGGAQACTLLTDGRFVRSGGFDSLNDTGATDIFTPATSAFTALATTIGVTGAAAYSDGAALVQLDSNRLLIMGAFNHDSTTGQTAEIYTFSSNSWALTNSLLHTRTGHRAVTLNDGSVLVVGGDGTNQPERFVGGVFKLTAGTMAIARSDGSSITKLTDGRVLVIGGSANAEIYDPATDKFTLTGKMSVSRLHHTATLLKDGRVLVAGGDGLSSSEIYDPAVGTFSAAGNMVNIRATHGAALMSDGRVIVAGGVNANPQNNDNTAEIWGNLNGATCSTNNDCVSNHCVDGVCCNVASCGQGFSCANPPKLGVCSKTLGESCAANADCASSQCADGVCCATACAGTCASCALPGKVGTCAPVVGQPAAGHGACTGAGVGTECGASCNGTSLTSCVTPSNTTVCGQKSCSSGKATALGTCNGGGACVQSTIDCGIYACDSTSGTCKTSCATKDDCATGFACDGGACVAPTDLGTACTSGAACSTGFCSDGVCCNVASCGVDASCALGQPIGTCGTKPGRACTADRECGTGHCVDGVCCDSACGGQCQACDVEGYVGVCSPVVGLPHGTRTPCDDGGGDVCKAKACKGGEDPTQCTAFLNGPKVQCSAGQCDKSGQALAAAFCDGAGSCGKAVSSSCIPFACSAGKCLTSCTDNTQCAPGSLCTAGRCEASGGTCSADLTSSTSSTNATVSCAPYYCIASTGACAQSCTSTNDCATGSCDTNSGTCVATDAGTGSGGGCSEGAGGASAAGLWCLVLAAIAAARRARA